MKRGKWPRWLKSGIIAGLIPLTVWVLGIFIKTPGIGGYSTHPTIFKIWTIVIIPANPFFILFQDNLYPLALLLMLVEYFLIGVFIDWIIEKIKT